MDSSKQEATISKLQESLAKEKHGTAGARARTVNCEFGAAMHTIFTA